MDCPLWHIHCITTFPCVYPTMPLTILSYCHLPEQPITLHGPDCWGLVTHNISEAYLVLLFVEEVCGCKKSTSLIFSRSSFSATLLMPGAGVAFIIIIISLACHTHESVPLDGPA